MDQFQSQSIVTSNKTLIKRKWPIFLLALILLLTSFAAGFGSGFLVGQKKLFNNNLFLQPKTELNDSKSISGTISNISGNTLTITNAVAGIGSSSEQSNMSSVYKVEITSSTKLSKTGGPIEPGELLSKSTKISSEELKPGMIVNIETSEPLSSSSLKAVSIEAQPGVSPEQSNTAPPLLPPPSPIDISKIATKSASPANNP